MRPASADRKFKSAAVESFLQSTKAKIPDPELAWLFENCFPNTLDTTVSPGTLDGKPDTFVITGDIHAMWLRDSSAQVWPYVPLASSDPELRALLEGVIRRQARCLLLDPYANAFLESAASTPLEWALHDDTEMKRGVGERKWEIDSICYPIRLAHRYWQVTKDRAPFDATFRQAMHVVVDTLRTQQRLEGKGPYHFQRTSANPTETLGSEGYGAPTRPNGLVHSGFRPSDDACQYPYLIPSNLFAVVSLRQLKLLAVEVLNDRELATAAESLASSIESALEKAGKAHHPEHGEIWAYEVDGFGNAYFADDANIPSLLSLPYLGAVAKTDPVYLKTRAFVLSTSNPWFFHGSVAEGVGGPHVGADMIWPMSITMRAFTSSSDPEIRQCLLWLKASHAGTGFMHESFDKNNPKHFTRPWFAWANTLFGELIAHLASTRPSLLAA